MIYLDNAATTVKKPPQVAAAIVEALGTMGNAARGVHDVSLQAARCVYDTRVKLARMFGCPDPGRVVFTANATEALNIAIFGTLPQGGHVISTDLEHNSVLRPLYAVEERYGVELEFVKADPQGCIDYEEFQRKLRPDTQAIVCTHASNLTGQVLDIGRIGAIAKKQGILFIVDASQTAGSIPIDMQAMQIDILCFTGHKGLMGPQGTGGLCVMPGVEIAPWKQGGSGIHSYERGHPMEYPTRLEAGTLNSHGIAGLGAALDFIEQTGIEAIGTHEQHLLCRFYAGVNQIPGVTVYGEFTNLPHCAIVALNIRDYDSGAVADALSQEYGIYTRAGAHCAPRMHQALGTREQGAVRFSFSWYNTVEDVDAAIAAVREIAAEEA